MLAGQVISFGDSIVISLTGLLIVMLELAFLAIFIQVMSKVLTVVVKDKVSNREKSLAVGKELVESGQEDDELAMIMATVLEEMGEPLESVIFRSVTRIQ